MVVIDVTLDSSGSVNNMRVLGGPEQLRRAVMQSVLQWHFTADSAGKTRQVSVNFQLPPDAATPAPTAIAQVAGNAADESRVIRSITVAGLPESAKTQLLASLPVHEGDSANMRELLRTLPPAVKQFDEHLNVAFLGVVSPTGGPAEIGVAISAPGAATLAGQAAGQSVRIASGMSLPAAAGSAGAQPSAQGVLGGILSAAPSAPASGSGGVLGGVLASAPAARQSEDAPSEPQRIRVGGNVQQAKLISQPKPIYPPLAKQARISGAVTFNVVVGTDGTVIGMEVVNGHPLLVNSAIEAVRQWVYQPTLLNGNPVEVFTQVVVNFALSDAPPDAM
jgi:TonB family protein